MKGWIQRITNVHSCLHSHPPDAIFIRNVQDVEVKPKEYPA